MTLKLENKKAIVAEVTKIATNAVSAIAVKYQGLTVAQMTKLRVQARNSGVFLRVVRNTLARRALEGTKFADMRELLVGPLMLVFSQDEPGASARLLRSFAKEHEKLVVEVISVEGRIINVKSLDAIASLPSRAEAIATLMAVIKAPITKFVRTLAEPHAKLVRTVAAIRDKKQAA